MKDKFWSPKDAVIMIMKRIETVIMRFRVMISCVLTRTADTKQKVDAKKGS